MGVCMTELVLASGSPRRKELLEKLGVQFRVRGADIDEDSSERDPARMVETLALEKARAVRLLEPQAAIIAADTTVAIDGEILNKPANIAQNAEFIARLAGAWHEVYTGVAVLNGDRQAHGAECTRVKFRELSSQEIAGYAASGEGLDKAGGYGIQAMGMALVERIEGDYFNVMGLPVVRTVLLARSAGLELLSWGTA